MKPVTVIIIAVLVGAAAFFGGMQFQTYQLSKTRGNFMMGGTFRTGQFGGQGQNARFRMNGRPVVGEVASQDANSLTVKMQDGSSKIVILSDTTTYSKTDQGSKSDLKAGERVAVIGTENSDGSVTAQNIQLNPMFRMQSTSPTPSK